MPKTFEVVEVILDGAEIEYRTNYGGKRDALFLESNNAFRLPFVIRVPAGFNLGDVESRSCIAHFRRYTSRMEANGGVDFDGGVDFEIYELNIRPVDKICNPDLPKCTVVVKRVFDDLLPLADEVKDEENPAQRRLWCGYKIPDDPGLPTRDDPIVVTSHTLDGGGWHTYLVYTERDEEV